LAILHVVTQLLYDLLCHTYYVKQNTGLLSVATCNQSNANAHL